MPKCPHGNEIGLQSVSAQQSIDGWGDDYAAILEKYSACDCCDTLCHHDTCGIGYFVMDDGRTLCSGCVDGTREVPTL